jgi:hypothetical protein
MWKKIKQFLQSKSASATPKHLERDGELITDAKYMANTFNNFFVQIQPSRTVKYDRNQTTTCK